MSKNATALTRRNVWNLSGVGSEHCAPGAMGKAEDAHLCSSDASLQLGRITGTIQDAVFPSSTDNPQQGTEAAGQDHIAPR